MSSLGALLGGLSGLVGGVNSNRGIQIFGTGSVDLSSPNPVTLYISPAGNTDQIVLIGAVLRDSNGTTPNFNFPTLVVVYVNGVAAIQMPDQSYQNLTTPFYSCGFAPGQLFIPLSSNVIITAQVLNPQATPEVAKVDLIGYSIPA